jgi:transcription initiation factor TFIIH subunit 1
MFASKAGIPKKRLRLHEAGLEVPYQFSFTSPGPIAETELDNFKRLLAAVVSNNTDPTSSGTSKPLRETNSIPSSPLPIPSTPYRASPSPYSPASSAGVSKKGGRFVPEIYSKVLIKNPQLAELHRILVEGKQITEQEFWEGREVKMIFN